jgi:uncharacterized LabA/DUF88 family protein
MMKGRTEHLDERQSHEIAARVSDAMPGKQNSGDPSLSETLASLAAEVGRMKKSLSRIEQQLASDKREATEQAAHPSALVEIKERVMKEAISSARERRAIKKEIGELSTQLKNLDSTSRFSARSSLDVPEAQLRVGIFVDVQNIFYAAKQFNARLDFEKLLKVVVGKRRLIRAIAYVVQSPEVDQTGFISMLQLKGYDVRQKDLRTRSDGSAKGDWDMGMAIDIMELVDRLDVIALVTGDGDFVSLLNLVKTIGPRVEVISFLHNTARDLVQSADLHTPIEEALLMRPPNGGNGINRDTPENASSGEPDAVSEANPSTPS